MRNNALSLKFMTQKAKEHLRDRVDMSINPYNADLFSMSMPHTNACPEDQVCSTRLLSHTNQIVQTLQSLCNDDLVQLNNVIEHHLEQRVPLIGKIAKHLILAGGKRIRPLLAFACCRALTEKPSLKMVELAASIEFIHNATLLHDDVIDESPLRRGKPTANAIWGNKPSILVGDFLFAKAFELMLGENEKRVLPILAKVSQTITEGEVFQLSYLQTFELDESILFQIMATKTAALFAASCEISAALFKHTQEEQKALHDYGYNLGITFQIVDDLLDYIGTTESLGKNVGDDLKEGKVTLPLYIAYKNSSENDRALLRSMICNDDRNLTDLNHVTRILYKTKAIDECLKHAHLHAEKAVTSLSTLPSSDIRFILQDLCYSLVDRQN